MRLDKKFSGWGLNPQGASDAPCLNCKRPLSVESSEMLDDAVGEYNVKTFVSIGETTTIASYKLKSVSELIF